MVLSSSSAATNKLITTLNQASTKLVESFAKLSSGKRIVSAKDDAAGLAVVSSLTADVAALQQGTRNAQDGLSYASIADSSLSQISEITTRQAELATQAANGTLSDDQRSVLNHEYQSLEAEKTRILETSTFNDQSVFSGTTLQVGSSGDSSSQIAIPAVDRSSITNSSANILTQGAAQSALDSTTTQLEAVASTRGQIGATISRLDVATRNNQSIAAEQTAAASRIQDLDIASELSKAMNLKLQQSAATSFLSQAGKATSTIIKNLIA